MRIRRVAETVAAVLNVVGFGETEVEMKTRLLVVVSDSIPFNSAVSNEWL
jgi:hypothetical protein